MHCADGGETKLDNLMTLCRFHHRELHKGNYFLSLKPMADESAARKSNRGNLRFAERLCFSRGGAGFKKGELLWRLTLLF